MGTKLRHVSDVPVQTGLPKSLPNPIKSECFVGKHEAQLGKAVGLTQFGVNHLKLVSIPKAISGRIDGEVHLVHRS